MSDAPSQQVLRRWRLLLGRYAQDTLGQDHWSARELAIDQSLEFLYGREYQGRDLRRAGGLQPSQLTAIDWLHRSRQLFPKDVCERMQAQALEKYHLMELLNDPVVVQQLEPNPSLLSTLLRVRGRLRDDVGFAVRELIQRTVAQIVERLRPQVTQALQGRRHRFRSSPLKNSQNFDWRKTIQANLKHYNPERRSLVLERLYFQARTRRHLPWDIILCVDQSASMTNSVMYSAVLAGILCSLPSVRVRLVVFDTQVLDLTSKASDPVEILMTVQLGGGTNIGQAMQYCASCVTEPQRTVVALISDFCEGAHPRALLACVRQLAEQRVKLLGLAALDDEVNPCYDNAMAQRLTQCGMNVAAMTPVHFAQWLAEVMG